MNKSLVLAAAAASALALAGCGEQQPTADSPAAPANTNGGDAAQAPNGDWTQVVTRTDDGGFRMGNPDARVQLVEYASMTCPHCARFSEQAHDPLKQNYVRTGEVSFEFRNFVLNPLDLAASVLARCQGEGPFFRLTEQLFAEQQQWMANLGQDEAQRIAQLPNIQAQLQGYAQGAELDQFFRRRGLPEARIQACLSEQQELERLSQMANTASSQHGVSGTPSFLINGQLVQGSDWNTLEAELRRRLGR